MGYTDFTDEIDRDTAARRNCAAIAEAERAEILLAAAKRGAGIDPVLATLAAAALTGLVQVMPEAPNDVIADHAARLALATRAALGKAGEASDG